MPDVGAAAGSAADKADGFFDKIVDFLNSTHIPRQVSDVDLGLFSNPWFLIPFLSLMGWWIYKQSFRDIILVLILMGIWYLSGTEYMQTLIVDGELQIGKILPVMFGGAAVLGFVIYLFFGRS
ncbi:MAG: hypothetical protein M8357_11530 [Desulfobulbaceae bacterium]|nr:hypothetical protein [Desulfobulbaceae bacterium]